MYELYFNWKFIWKKVGLASLTTNSTTYHSEPAYRVNLLAISSKGADFFFKMRDTLTSVMTEKLEPRYFRKGAEEGKRYTVIVGIYGFRRACVMSIKNGCVKTGITETEQSDNRCIYDMLAPILAQTDSFDPRNIPSVNVSRSSKH